MAYLSVPSPGKWILDIFGKHIFRHFFEILDTNIFQKNGPQMAPLAQVPG